MTTATRLGTMLLCADTLADSIARRIGIRTRYTQAPA